MKISDIFEEKVVYSFEIFPPKRELPIENINDTLERLSALSPDFISVTYGAGGNISDDRTSEIAKITKNKFGVEALAHLTGINSSKEDILHILGKLEAGGVENILAMRGDRKPNQEPLNDFPHASDLVRFIKQNGNFNIAGACYPEGHPDCSDKQTDINNLKAKVSEGATHLITQLFFDNNDFYSFEKRAREVGIAVPIQPGIMPVINKKSVFTIVELCKAKMPEKLLKMIDKYEDNKEALFDAGVDYATEQIINLLENSARGIHLYTMNNPKIAEKITHNITRYINK